MAQSPRDHGPARLYAIVSFFTSLFFPSLPVRDVDRETQKVWYKFSCAPARPCRRAAWHFSGTRLGRMLCRSRTIASVHTGSPAPPDRLWVGLWPWRVWLKTESSLLFEKEAAITSSVDELTAQRRSCLESSNGHGSRYNFKAVQECVLLTARAIRYPPSPFPYRTCHLNNKHNVEPDAPLQTGLNAPHIFRFLPLYAVFPKVGMPRHGVRFQDAAAAEPRTARELLKRPRWRQS